MKKDPGAETNVFRQEWTQKLESRGQFEVVQAGFKIMRGQKMVMGKSNIWPEFIWNLKSPTRQNSEILKSLFSCLLVVNRSLRPQVMTEGRAWGAVFSHICEQQQVWGRGYRSSCTTSYQELKEFFWTLCVCVEKREWEVQTWIHWNSALTSAAREKLSRSPAAHWQATCVDMNQSSNSIVISEAQWGNTNIRLLFS